MEELLKPKKSVLPKENDTEQMSPGGTAGVGCWDPTVDGGHLCGAVHDVEAVHDAEREHRPPHEVVHRLRPQLGGLCSGGGGGWGVLPASEGQHPGG